MASACAPAIFSGKIIFYFGIAERLRTLRYSLFTKIFLTQKAAARNVQQPFVCLSGYPVWHHSTMMLLPVISAGTGRPI